MKEIILLVGSLGSGKTTLGNQLIKDMPHSSLFIDDIGVVTQNAKEYLSQLDNHLTHLIISDVYFCQSRALNMAKKMITALFPDVLLDLLYFENSPEKCYQNVAKRKTQGDSREVNHLITLLSKNYVTPEKTIIIHSDIKNVISLT